MHYTPLIEDWINVSALPVSKQKDVCVCVYTLMCIPGG